MNWEERKQCHWLSFAIVFHMMNAHHSKVLHTSCLFSISLWRGFGKEKYLLPVVLGQDVMFICRNKGHLLAVIDPLKFETFFQVIVYHQHSIVHSIMADNDILHKHPSCLLSLSRSDVVWDSVVSLTPCPWETGLISLLTIIDKLTFYWTMG